jgi:predicted metalloprotease with PDZ domain
MRFTASLVAAALIGGLWLPASGQPLPPQPEPLPPAIAAPRDVAYPGVLTLDVDATDIERRIFSVRQRIPVRPGPAVLLYPQWLPGNHAPRGRVDKLAGLTITAAGQALDWRRDDVNVFAFHIDVPEGASALDITFQFLSPTDTNQGRVVMTPDLLNLQWNTVLLYPAGFFARQIPIEASVRLPRDWKFATALDGATRDGDQVAFARTSIETLVDSPMFAGRNAVTHLLSAPGAPPVRLNVFADEPGHLAAKPEHLKAHGTLVEQMHKTFGPGHYEHYDFLLALSDQLGGIGLEHHRSSENGTDTGYFTEWDKTASVRDLLPHEFVHSWNGKFRRPADLWTANYNVPMRDGLLWVYEGQTQYWGVVLAARSGLITKQQALDSLADTAATYDIRVGRSWKPLQDTTNDPISTARQPMPWRSWQRSEDYYSEGQLVWLDVDTLIRERTRGRRSLDDFARAFFGGSDGTARTSTYGFDDVVAALNAIAPYAWAGMLRERLDTRAPGAPLDGLERGGYRLIYNETETEFAKGETALLRNSPLTHSLGLTIGREGRVTEVIWDGPAYGAGLTAGTQIVAVNGIAYEFERLKTVITDAKLGSPPIELLVKSGDHYRTVAIDYRGGLRYPRLERTGSGSGALDDILAPRR